MMKDDVAFVDTNVLVYHLMQTDDDFSPRSSRLFASLQTSETKAYLASTVIFECIYVLQRQYAVPNEPLAVSLKGILTFPGLQCDHLDALVAALDFWKDQGPLSFADCFHLALAKRLGMSRIYTFDQKMERYPGVERIEP